VGGSGILIPKKYTIHTKIQELLEKTFANMKKILISTVFQSGT